MPPQAAQIKSLVCPDTASAYTFWCGPQAFCTQVTCIHVLLLPPIPRDWICSQNWYSANGQRHVLGLESHKESRALRSLSLVVSRICVFWLEDSIQILEFPLKCRGVLILYIWEPSIPTVVCHRLGLQECTVAEQLMILLGPSVGSDMDSCLWVSTVRNETWIGSVVRTFLRWMSLYRHPNGMLNRTCNPDNGGYCTPEYHHINEPWTCWEHFMLTNLQSLVVCVQLLPPKFSIQ